MRIGIDARPLQGETRFRGIGKSMEYLMQEVAEQYADVHEFVFYVDRNEAIPDILTRFPGYKTRTVPSTLLGTRRYFRSFLNSYRCARPNKRDVDVFFQYDASLGIPTSVPCVTVFHDIIPLLFRNQEKKQIATGLRKYKNKLAGTMYWHKYLRIIRRYKKSRKLIAISEASKKDYLEHMKDVPEKDIVVIYHGLGGTAGATIKPSKAIKTATSKPYIMYLGGIDFRKNIAGLLKAFYELKPDHPELRLIAAGKEFMLTDQLGDMGWNSILESNKTYAKDVITPGFTSPDDMAYLYRHAEAFVHPTLYEGFGLPILEAMNEGCPVVCYDNSSLPELVGDAALMIKSGTPLAPAVRKVLDNPKIAADLAKKGKAQAKKFTWATTASKTINLLVKVDKNQLLR